MFDRLQTSPILVCDDHSLGRFCAIPDEGVLAAPLVLVLRNPPIKSWEDFFSSPKRGSPDSSPGDTLNTLRVVLRRGIEKSNPRADAGYHVVSSLV